MAQAYLRGDRPNFHEYARFSSIAYSDKLPEYFAHPDPKVADSATESECRADVKILIDGGWHLKKQVLPESSTGGYSGVIFIHGGRGQVVAAHRGTQNFGSKETDLLGVVLCQITDQEKAALALTEEAVKLSKVYKAHLSSTGHSLGGWLAQICLFHCLRPEALGRELEYKHVSAFTFDNPGSSNRIDKLQPNLSKIDLSEADITSVLSWPNSVNTCGTQLSGTVYFVNPHLDDNFLSYLLYSFTNAHPLKHMRRVFGSAVNFPPAESCRLMYDWPIADHKNLLQLGSDLVAVAGGVISGQPPAMSVARLVAAIPDFFTGIYGFLTDPKRIRGTLEGDELKAVFKNIDPRYPDNVSAIANINQKDLYALLTTGHFYVGVTPYQQSMLMKHFDPEVRSFLLMYKANVGLADRLHISADEQALLNQCILSETKAECSIVSGSIFEFRRHVTDWVLSRSLDLQIATLIQTTVERTIAQGEVIKNLVTDSEKKQKAISDLQGLIASSQALIATESDKNSDLYKLLDTKIKKLEQELKTLLKEMAIINGNVNTAIAVFAYESAVAKAKGTIAFAAIGSAPASEDPRAQNALDAAKEVALAGVSTIFIDRGAYHPDGDAVAFIGYSAPEAAKAAAIFKQWVSASQAELEELAKKEAHSPAPAAELGE